MVIQNFAPPPVHSQNGLGSDKTDDCASKYIQFKKRFAKYLDVRHLSQVILAFFRKSVLGYGYMEAG